MGGGRLIMGRIRTSLTIFEESDWSISGPLNHLETLENPST